MTNTDTEQYDTGLTVKNDTQSVISFTKVSLPYGWLGNMSPHSIHYNGFQYRTSESLFQSMRFSKFPVVQQQIIDAKSPMNSKFISKRFQNLLTEDDYKNDVDNMRCCLWLKLEQHPHLVPMLHETEDKLIVEDCSNRSHSHRALFWGAKWDDNTHQWVGGNTLGKLWMEIRTTQIREWCPPVQFFVN